ncbi:MAG: VOC family protein [Roseimicrobium sp.]
MSTIPFQAPGYHSVTPSLTVSNAAAALDFYQAAFGAVVVTRMDLPDGKVMHAEIQIGDSRIMLSDEFPDWQCLSPQSIGGTPCTLMVYVPAVDAAFAQAVAAGATVIQEPSDQFWGDRSVRLEDPFGHRWSLATHIEELTDTEIAERALKCLE